MSAETPDRMQQREQMLRDRALNDRDRAEQAKLVRTERMRHDAVGLAQDILDPRVRTPDVIQPQMIGLMLVAAKKCEQLSPYETNPISDALLIRAFMGNTERIQVKQVAERNAEMEAMLANPVLVSALYKYEEAYDPDIGDRPVEMSSEEWDAFGKYVVVKDEKDAIVDSMTNGVASLYDDKSELERRINRGKMRLADLKSREGSLTKEDKVRYQNLLAKMFGELRGAEAEKYSRWSSTRPENLTTEEQVMLEDIWEKMSKALDGGESGEKEELKLAGIKPLGAEAKKLFEKRLNQLRGAISDEEERKYFDRLMAISYREISIDESDELEAKLELLADEIHLSQPELKTFLSLKLKKEKAERLHELEEKEKIKPLGTGERGDFIELHQRAGSLTEAETESIEILKTLLLDMRNRVKDVDEKIKVKSEKLGKSNEWLNMAKAFNGIVDNINTTAAWRVAWHDLGAGAQDSFLQTRWAEYQKVSELVALMDLSQVGDAMQNAFQAMCKIGFNRIKEVPGSENVMLSGALTEEYIQSKLVEPVTSYAKLKMGAGAEDLYVDFGVEMARMLFENSFTAGFFGLEKDEFGNIMYEWDGKKSSDPSSDAYKYAQVKEANSGDGTVYPDRQNDYIKLAGTRAKQMSEFASGYETGLPALLPVLPDSLASPWISPAELREIADGSKSLKQVFERKKENSRWSWAYSVFRGAQVYEMISKFAVGMKGFRGIAEEVDFFLKSPSNLGSLSKKIDKAFGKDQKDEALRLKMNFVMTLLYASTSKFSNVNDSKELKIVVPSLSEAKNSTVVNFEKDDYERIFVRNGFISSEIWSYVWGRMGMIYPGGGKLGRGLIKKSEIKGIKVVQDEILHMDEKEGRRRKSLADQV